MNINMREDCLDNLLYAFGHACEELISHVQNMTIAHNILEQSWNMFDNNADLNGREYLSKCQLGYEAEQVWEEFLSDLKQRAEDCIEYAGSNYKTQSKLHNKRKLRLGNNQGTHTETQVTSEEIDELLEILKDI